MCGKLILSVCLAMILLAALNCQGAPVELPAGLAEAAQAGLRRFASELTTGELQKLGLPGKDTLTLATLGRPFQVFHVLPESLTAGSTNVTINQVAAPSTLWYFPVLIDHKARAVVFVDRVQSEWKGVSLGHLALAAELKTIQDQWPESSGYHPRLLVSNQANRQFFTVPEVDNVNMTPLAFDTTTPTQQAFKALAPKYSHLEKCSDHVSRLKHDINAAINAQSNGHRHETQTRY